MIRVEHPAHLRALARVNGEITIETDGTPTVASLLDAIEARYPVLRGTIRDRQTGVRRPFVRFFACRTDLSHLAHDVPLPQAVATGTAPFLIVGAMAGG